MGGVVCVNDEQLAQEIGFHQNAEGTALAPFDCWLMLRGIKTLALRLERSLENSAKVAAFLENHECVKKLYWVGDGGDTSIAEKRTHKRQARNTGCLISFETGCVDFSQRFMEACRIFRSTEFPRFG